jgi:hypothetical protein
MIMVKSNACGVCGRKGKRNCPAVGGVICPACCGAKRGGELDCPPDCSSYPFGTEAYDLWLRVDGAWFPKAFEYVNRHVRKSDFSAMNRRLTTTTRSDREVSEEAGIINAVHYFLGVSADDAGRTLGEQWESDGWIGLNNDERIMTMHRRHTWPAIIEVQKVLSDHAMECIDVLDPDRGVFLTFDRCTAERAVRFSRYLVWVTHYPHFSRMAGVGMEVSSHIHEEFMEVLQGKVGGRKRHPDMKTVKRHLAENFADCCDLIGDLCLEYRERAFRSMDIVHCRAWYDFKAAKDDIQAVIDKKADFEFDQGREPEPEDPSDTLYYDWLRRGAAKAFEKGMPSCFQHDDPEAGVGTLGTLRLYGNGLMLETFGKSKFDFAQKLIRRYFGQQVTLRDEKLEDLTEKILSGEQAESPETAPEAPCSEPDFSPEVEQEILQKFHRQHYEKFLDDSIPMLDGMTPREAAVSPEMRPQLIELMKLHVHGIEQRSRDEGIAIDLNWVLEELDLDELG